MHVVIGIITRNRANVVTKAIESALAQDFPNTRVVVFDDASTDETAELSKRYPSVAWRRSSHVQGYLALRNLLMKESAADFFCSLDDDAWFLSDDVLSAGVSYLAQHDSVAALAYDIVSPDKPDVRPRLSPFPINIFIGCGHLLRLRPVRKAGYYIAGPGWYGGEEKDLCIRLLDSGHQVMKLPGVHVWHDKTTIARDQRVQYSSGVANDLALTLRRTPIGVLPIALAGKVFQHLGFALRNRLLPSCFNGFRLFFGHLGELWHSRRPVKLATLRTYRRLSRANS